MIAFIDDHRETYGVEPIYRVLPIAPSTYRAYTARRADPGKLPPGAKRDAVLMAEIRRVHAVNFGVMEFGRSGGSSPARGSWQRAVRWLG